jgi:hypothetical protein
MDAGFAGKSLKIKENLLNFFRKFIPFRLPIKMPVFRVKGHTRDFPGVPFSSRDRFPKVQKNSGTINIQTILLYIKKSGSFVGFRPATG